MKIMIVGGAGFIGYYLTRLFREAGDEVVIFDSLQTFSVNEESYRKYLPMRLEYLKQNAEIVKGDIRDREHLLSAMEKFKPDVVVHLAAISIAPVSNKIPEEAISINIQGTVNVLTCARKLGTVKRLVFASSSMAYGDFVRVPVRETDETDPVDVYGATKLCGEKLIKAYNMQYGLKYTIVRPSAVYGPLDTNNRVTQIFAENAAHGKPIMLHDKGSAMLDFTYVEDAAQGFFLASKKHEAENEIFNITRGEGRTLKELANILKKHKPDIGIVYKKSDMRRPVRGTLDITKAKKRLGYKPKYSLEDGMNLYFEFVKKNI
ncbi:MAG: NAD-dependent epimerase/dehydratase family protein [Candidatus Aenigmarchaeota archaeon]|nr:NAD-dependent epimerase/dehydratase family protein [Candidatus Aenigmarchaeota archaeon]